MEVFLFPIVADLAGFAAVKLSHAIEVTPLIAEDTGESHMVSMRG